MTIDSTTRTRRPPAEAGPPLAPLAGISLALLLAGLAIGAALGGVIPSPFGDPDGIVGYFARNPAAVRTAAVSLFASAIPLAIYAAVANSRLRSLGVTAPGATIALAGGVLSAGMAVLAALFEWVLSRPEVGSEPALVRALHDLSFLTGGVAHVVFLGLLIAGIAVPGLIIGLLPRAVAITGLVIAVVAELASVSLIWDGAAILLPLARFPGLIWLVVAGALLPRRRPRRAPVPSAGLDTTE